MKPFSKAIELKLILIIFLITLACFKMATAQKRTFYKEGKLVDSIHSPILKYFSNLYDTVIAYDLDNNWLMLKRHCSVFAIKEHKYYKLDCLIGFFRDYPRYDSIQITKTVACSDTAGKAFLKVLEKYHIYNLPISQNEGSCTVYDSSRTFVSGYAIEDGGFNRFQYFDKTTFRTVEYYAPKDLYKACRNPKLIPTIKLIDLFEKDWQTK